MNNIPIITIDGPTCSGKGTIARRISKSLRWNLLDSGILYRLVALSSMRRGFDPRNEVMLAILAQHLKISVCNGCVYLEEDVSNDIRGEGVGNYASCIAAFPSVRKALIPHQRVFEIAPGLVADGRDMGTAVFPYAQFKFFLTASITIRAERRYKQLMEIGNSARLENVMFNIRSRDSRDAHRSSSPLVPAPDAQILDSSDLTVEQTVHAILDSYYTKLTNF